MNAADYEVLVLQVTVATVSDYFFRPLHFGVLGRCCRRSRLVLALS